MKIKIFLLIFCALVLQELSAQSRAKAVTKKFNPFDYSMMPLDTLLKAIGQSRGDSILSYYEVRGPRKSTYLFRACNVPELGGDYIQSISLIHVPLEIIMKWTEAFKEEGLHYQSDTTGVGDFILKWYGRYSFNEMYLCPWGWSKNKTCLRIESYPQFYALPSIDHAVGKLDSSITELASVRDSNKVYLWTNENVKHLKFEVSPMVNYIIEEREGLRRLLFIEFKGEGETGLPLWYFRRNFPQFLGAGDKWEGRVVSNKGAVIPLGYLLDDYFLSLELLTRHEYDDLLNELISENVEEEVVE